MLLNISNVLSEDELTQARAELDRATFVDGKATAGWHSKLVKHNVQAKAGDPALAGLRALISKRIEENDLFRMAVRPKKVTPIMLSKYEPGMKFGTHVDNAVMNGMRTDVSFTLFLSDPESYDGGALVIETTAGEQEIKLPAGAMVVYPSMTLHRVSEVTRGERLAAVGWARSMIRDPAERELLFDLETARMSLFQREGKSPEFDLLSKCLSNLLRMWIED